jgi:hypothetical protein
LLALAYRNYKAHVTLMFMKLNIDRTITKKPIEGLEGDITLSKWLDGFLSTQEAIIGKAKKIQRAAKYTESEQRTQQQRSLRAKTRHVCC